MYLYTAAPGTSTGYLYDSTYTYIYNAYHYRYQVLSILQYTSKYIPDAVRRLTGMSYTRVHINCGTGRTRYGIVTTCTRYLIPGTEPGVLRTM